MNNHNQTFKTLYSSLDISFENYEQDLRDLILSLAFLDSKDIPISFLKTLSQSELQFNKLMNALNCQSIISRSHQQNQFYCSVHPLFQEVIQTYLKNNPNQEKPIIRNLIQIFSNEFLFDWNDQSTWICINLTPHLIQFFNFCEEINFIPKNIEKLLDLLGDVFLYLKANYDQALKYYQKSQKIRIQTLGKEHPDVAICYNNIGRVHSSKGNYEQALEFYQKSLKIRIQVLGKEHPEVASSYNNIGLVHKSKGNYEQALEFLQKSLKIRIQTLGKEHPYVATSYNNIGIVHYFKGNYEQALEFLQKSLKIKIQTLGKEHPDVATSYTAISNLVRTI
ncbi:tetratricopeptide repeat protein [Anaeramoeba flamelloides]|uniref:Tetratricopeptide repeat protein n=1 Tax=Anaeramoeba flamelloides TaxID=1746091 RepID=A0ABQ8Y4P5_9EUKA|nr:tetratricopeptide repeat protein [Anaeramoeba flamelloides]